mgnify:FL=1
MVNTLKTVKTIVERHGAKYEELNYPKRGKKSVDLLVVSQKRTFLLKVVDDYTKASKAEVEELKKAAASLNGKPAIVSELVEDPEVSIDRGVPVIHPLALEKFLSGEKLFAIMSKGEVFIKIDHEKLRKKREESGMSIGDVANRVGISRISVYEYERGIVDKVTLPVAEKLVDLFGDDILGDVMDVDLGDIVQETYTYDDSKRFKTSGYTVFEFSFTVMDFVATKGDEKILGVVTNEEIKINETKKVERLVGGRILILDREKGTRG